MPRFKILPIAVTVASAFALADTPGPTDVTADHIDGTSDAEVRADGNVVITRDNQKIEADWARLFRGTSEIHAGDHTRLTEKGDVIDGGELNMRDDIRVGTLEAAKFQMSPRRRVAPNLFDPTPTRLSHGGHGDADRVYLEGEDKYRLEKARFTTCAVGDEEWYVRAPEMNLDYTQDLGVAHSGVIEFQGVPILYAPYLDFSLDGARKSGLLAPTIGYTGNRGFDITQPYYWNIAPNMDATIAPRIMSKRGLMLDNEFRYLGPTYSGVIEADVITHDAGSVEIDANPAHNETGVARHWYSLLHHQLLYPGLTADLNVQEASDGRYFADFGDRLVVAATQVLPHDARLTYTLPGFSASVDFSSFQTLQDPNAPITPPYAREPQVTVQYNPLLSTGFRLAVQADAVSFRNAPIGQPNGARYHVYPALSFPIERSWGFINPSIGFDATRYHLENGFNINYPDGTVTTLPNGTNISRNLMRASVDSGLYFDRDIDFFGRSMVQSLEPRLYYVRIPYKNQDDIPLFDSGQADFSFAQMFSDNKFVGEDRLNDANQLTTAVTSRLFESDSGIERGRVTLGQRFYFTQPKVTLNPGGTQDTNKSSDILATLGVQPAKDIWVDAGWDYDNHAHQSSAESFGVSYQPTPGRLLNLRYRLDTNAQNPLKQYDISTEWPLTNRWHGLARYNWSILDHRAFEALGGVEYNGGCWVLRMVGQRYVTSATTASNGFFFQLELNDLGRLGSNPLQVLKDSIPGYTKLN